MAAPTPATVPQSRPDRGKVVVVGMFGVALALAAFAWWWNVNQNRRSRAFWGQENVRLIRTAPQVELWELTRAEASMEEADTLAIDDVAYRITNRRNLSEARGLVHARYALADDASFDLSASDPDATPAPTPDWRWGIQFHEGSDHATVIIDTASNRVRCLETGKEISVLPRIIAGWRRLAEREGVSEGNSRSPKR